MFFSSQPKPCEGRSLHVSEVSICKELSEVCPMRQSAIQNNTNFVDKILDETPSTINLPDLSTLPIPDEDSPFECEDFNNDGIERSNESDVDFLDWNICDLDPVQVEEATNYAKPFTDKHAPSILKSHKKLIDDPLEEICKLGSKYPVQFLSFRQFLEQKITFFQSCSKVAFDSLMLTTYHLLITYIIPETTKFPLLRGMSGTQRMPCRCKSHCDNLECQCRITVQSCLNLCHPESSVCLNRGSSEQLPECANKEGSAILQQQKFLFPGYGGSIMQDNTEICPIDNWIAQVRVIHIVFNEMLVVSSRLTPPLCKIQSG